MLGTLLLICILVLLLGLMLMNTEAESTFGCLGPLIGFVFFLCGLIGAVTVIVKALNKLG